MHLNKKVSVRGTMMSREMLSRKQFDVLEVLAMEKAALSQRQIEE